MAANDAIRLYVDLCQVVDPIKRNGLRTLLQELTAKKTAREIPSVTQAFLERVPALVLEQLLVLVQMHLKEQTHQFLTQMVVVLVIQLKLPTQLVKVCQLLTLKL